MLAGLFYLDKPPPARELDDTAPYIVPNASRPPYDILLQIFNNVLEPKERWNFTPESHLVPFLLVNKWWSMTAHERLYRSISLGQSSDKPAQYLLSTLESNPRLAALILELRLGTIRHDRIETRNYISILNRCPNVIHIQISGYSGYELGSYRASLQRKSLVSFTVSRYGLSNMISVGFCTPAQLLQMMSGWPRLKNLVLYKHTLVDGSIGHHNYNRCCPHLREIMFQDGNFADDDALFAFSKAAPSVEKVSLHMSPLFCFWTTPAIESVLQSWSESLRSLSVSSTSTHFQINSIFPQLKNLEYLQASSLILAASALRDAVPNLSTFHYHATCAALQELTLAVHMPTFLPSLKLLTVLPLHPGRENFPEGLIASLSATCANRTIQLVIS